MIARLHDKIEADQPAELPLIKCILFTYVNTYKQYYKGNVKNQATKAKGTPISHILHSNASLPGLHNKANKEYICDTYRKWKIRVSTKILEESAKLKEIE